MVAATTIGLLLTPGIYFMVQWLSERMSRSSDKERQ
jgi:HAE1 family hydrophobic/amphiphilic exporter-1/multidrug efflux pump